MRTNLEELTDLETCSLPVAQHCRDALAALPPAPASELENETDPLDWNDWVRRPRKKLQKLLNKRYDEKLFTTLLATMDAPARARLHSCSGPFASAWQWAAPGNHGEQLDDEDDIAMARMLLGQPVVPALAFWQNPTRTCKNAGNSLR